MVRGYWDTNDWIAEEGTTTPQKFNHDGHIYKAQGSQAAHLQQPQYAVLCTEIALLSRITAWSFYVIFGDVWICECKYRVLLRSHGLAQNPHFEKVFSVRYLLI